MDMSKILFYSIVLALLFVSFFFVPRRIKFMYIGFVAGYFLFCTNQNLFSVISTGNEVLWTLGSASLK
nr:MAG TPA: hypothetical protein [Caudoviricetes sp.]